MRATQALSVYSKRSAGTITATLSEGVLARCDALCEREDITRSDLVRVALNFFFSELQKEEEESDAEFLRTRKGKK